MYNGDKSTKLWHKHEKVTISVKITIFCPKYQVPSAVCTIHDVYKSTAVCSAISIKCLLLNVQFSMSTKALQYSMFCPKYQVSPSECTIHNVYKSTAVCSAISIE